MKKPTLRIASCQFPVTGVIAQNARYIRRYMKEAAAGGAQLLHTSETCLSGYVLSDYPQIYAAYRQMGVEVMLHSFYNAGHEGPTCLCEMTPAQVVTRCADNGLWAIANNSARRYSAWGSLVARPDGTTARRLPQNRAGILVHDFPDSLSAKGWLHNVIPLKLAADQAMHFGKVSGHPRQADGASEP